MATIPEYEGIRAVVPDTYDPLRRAGSGGQRYFTDVEYVPVPSFRGDRATYDVQNYLAANPDVQDYYDTNRAALLAGGDKRYETPEGFGKWHYETVGKWENRNLTPTHDAAGNVIPTPEGAANTRAANQQTALAAANVANPAREGLSSLQRVTDTALATDIGEIQAYDATDRQKIDQTIGYMNEQAVSPYRLSTVTGTPLSDIQTAMNPYYRTPAEQKAQKTPNVGIQTALNQAVTESQTRPYQNFLRHIPVDGTYSAEEIGSVTDLLNSGTITIDQIATYFNVPVEEVRQFYREQGNRQGFTGGGSSTGGVCPPGTLRAGSAIPAGSGSEFCMAIHHPNEPSYPDPDDTAGLPPGSFNAPTSYYKFQGPEGQWLYKAVEGMGRTQWDIDITKEEYDAAMAGRTDTGYQAGGGVGSLNPRGMYLGGSTDGMADNIPASINSNQPARLSDGEFVVPADVVSHLGNGNSDAGAHQLYGMMDRVRQARTGTAEQGRQINPGNFLT